jgi:hypothetical protein
MPYINGRFYANPGYGLALERARRSSSGRIWTEEHGQESGGTHAPYRRRSKHHRVAGGHEVEDGEHDEEPQNEREARLANVVHNETASLRQDPSASRKSSDRLRDLQLARVAVAEVANRALDSGHPKRVASSELTLREAKALAAGNPVAVRAHNASLAAARVALGGSNVTDGATQYRLKVHPDAATPINGKAISPHFGPFRDTLGNARTVVIAP